MEHLTLVEELLEGLEEIPLLDVHTHLDASHLAARGLHDILLYHMVISDLVSAGCPSRQRLSEDPDDNECNSRLVEAIPYIRHIQNTGMFWGVKMILKDLYQWDKTITVENWQTLDAMIRERSGDTAWERQLINRSGILRSSTELWRRRDGSRDHFLQYSLEWAFFTRSQWGVNDISIIELERAWNQPGPSAPLPVTLGAERPELVRQIHKVEDVHLALDHYISAIPFDRIISTAQHFSTDITYRVVDDGEMAFAIQNRSKASDAEGDIYASYIQEEFLNRLEKAKPAPVYHFSIGAEPLPFETGSKLRQETIFELAAIIERHPDVHFQALLSNIHANQSMCTLARELHNLSLAGYWWHNFFPGAIRRIIGERLDMLAANRQVGFFSDAYCLDWAYAKGKLVRRQWAEVLALKVEQGQYTIPEALSIARQILFESPQSLVGMIPGN